MADLTVQVVTPEVTKFSGAARRVQLPGVLGDMGVLPQHAPLVSMLRPGQVEVAAADGSKYFAVGAGFATIANNQVVCLVDAAVEASEVDASKVTARISQIEQEIGQNGSSELQANELEYLRAQLTLKA